MMPRLQLMFFLGLAGIPFAVGLFEPAVIQYGLILTMLVCILAIFDILLTPSLRKVEIGRDVGEVMSVGAKNSVKIWLKNHNRRRIKVHVHDEPPQPCTIYDLPFHVRLSSKKKQTITYYVKPHHRGKNSFGTLFLETRSLFGLWTFHDERYIPQAIRVFPDIQAVHKVELLARQNRLAEAGVRMSRLKGRGSEFDRLREYRREDEYRNIDWKATARHQSLVSREYVVEKNQNILFLLDCGRSMANELDGITHFDRALNAAILLSYVALRQGDTVGMMVCSNKVERWVSPVRGLGSIRKLIGQTYDITPSYAASDYDLMVKQLRSRYRKRSLVVMLTHALDEVHMETISTHIRQLKKPHLVLGAFLRNVPLHHRLDSMPESNLDAFQIAAAADMVSTQSLQITKLEKTGVLVQDTLPEDLSANLISNYLEIKARHLL
ncbi:putative membrane protein [hydrothermal vent metagenome]|uniref:Putative membrane protein n=1 Tax=hydrothermal vent metagenome TaxID=652676 RepID=A0A3B1DX54_9ZZZZ